MRRFPFRIITRSVLSSKYSAANKMDFPTSGPRFCSLEHEEDQKMRDGWVKGPSLGQHEYPMISNQFATGVEARSNQSEEHRKKLTDGLNQLAKDI